MLTLVHYNREASVISLKPVTKEMIKIWKMDNVDWMGYKVNRKSTGGRSQDFHQAFSNDESSTSSILPNRNVSRGKLMLSYSAPL